MKCENCHNNHDGNFGSGRFCSRACANSRKHSVETKQKISISVKNSPKVIEALRKIHAKPKNRFQHRCPVCLNSFETMKWNKDSRIYCSRACYNADSELQYRYVPKGGIRKGAGRGIGGWYQGYHCDSTYELAWVFCQLQDGIEFRRNYKGFDYSFRGKEHKYYPDFYLDHEDKYIEIKGYISDKTKAKLEAFPFDIKVIDKNGIKPFLRRVKELHGKNFHSVLYEK